MAHEEISEYQKQLGDRLEECQKRTRAEFARKEAASKANGETDGYFEIFAAWDEAQPDPAIPRGMLPPKKQRAPESRLPRMADRPASSP